jgi:hypothetical protein
MMTFPYFPSPLNVGGTRPVGDPTGAYSGLKEVTYLSGVGVIVFNLIFDHGEWATATWGMQYRVGGVAVSQCWQVIKYNGMKKPYSPPTFC